MTRNTMLPLVLFGIASMLSDTAQAEIRYRGHFLDIPQCNFEPEQRYIIDRNDLGQVCGYLEGCLPLEAYFWDPQSRERIHMGFPPGCPGYRQAHPKAMNNFGHVVGVDPGTECNGEAWLWTRETGMRGLGDLTGGSVFSAAYGCNNLGQVVGYSWSEGGAEAFLWDAEDGMIGLGRPEGRSTAAAGINDSGWVVGTMTGHGAFMWTPQAGIRTLQQITNEAWNPSDAVAINGDGVVACFGGGLTVWRPNTGLQHLGHLYPDDVTHPTDINDRSEVVGWSDSDAHPAVPWVWDAQRGMRNLRELLDPCSVSPVIGDALFGSEISSINNLGEISLFVGAVNLFVLIPYVPGDLDESGVCDLTDLAMQLSNFGRAGDAAYEHGDLDCDQDVDLQDLAILLANFGETLP